MPRLPLMPLLLATAIGVIGVIGACDRDSDSATPAVPVEKVTVLASVYPLGDLAREIGGPDVDVSWVVESGKALSAVQSTADLRNRLRSVDLVLSGGATEAWASDGSSDPFQYRRIIRLDLLESAGNMPPGGLLWLDPVIVQDAARETAARLLALRPAREKLYRQRCDEYVKQLDALVLEHQSRLSHAMTKQLLVLSSEFDPLLLRFGLRPVPTVQVSPTQLDDAQIGLVKQVARTAKTRLLIVPADTPESVVRDLGVRSSLQIVLIDSLGSSAKAEGRDTYLNLMKFNLKQLEEATTVQ